jgi:hypothetical protein
MIQPLSPEAAYATSPNVKYPGTAAQATAAETVAQNRLNDYMSLTPSVTFAVAAGAISGKLAT